VGRSEVIPAWMTACADEDWPYLDEAGQRFGAEVGELYDAVVAWPVDPDQTVLLVHFVGNVPQLVILRPYGGSSIHFTSG
jgi:hypothetical protein